MNSKFHEHLTVSLFELIEHIKNFDKIMRRDI